MADSVPRHERTTPPTGWVVLPGHRDSGQAVVAMRRRRMNIATPRKMLPMMAQ